ncbi:FtsW/RodA/SpoVE family cell cycle protein [Limosilactobacillus viscerum]|uniref:FtsW/RodA/SpoVE family cell cycle protein n=1 Tax=Limosilactobacillus viscerum TaxID=2993450 RepID=UPI0024BACFE6|nr:putative peptidoglycan glycosyltransferase FtsW [Limosilactobacillus viscerum]
MKKLSVRRLPLKRVWHDMCYCDYYLLVPYLILCLVGVVMVYSSSAGIEMQNGGSPTGYLVKQAIYAILGVSCVLFFANFSLRHFRTRRFLKYSTFIMFFLLAIVLIVGRAVNGAKGWLSLGPINLQPAEFCKLYFILYLADRMDRARQRGTHFLDSSAAVGPLVFAAIFLLLILAQPDTGGFAINASIIIVMVLACDIKWGYGIGAIIFFPTAGYFLLEKAVESGLIHGGYRAQRFIAFMNPFGNASGSGSQLVNSYYAISNGGVFGVGLGNSIQKMGYLPEPNTDFIMAITSEELGLLGITAILGLLLCLICRIILVGVRSRSLYQTLICYGTATFMMVETFFNIGGVLGILPITGVTFPFISYGGSSMLVLSSAVGIIMNISMQQNKEQVQMGHPFVQVEGSDK